MTRSGADISDDELYRYLLWRVWDESLPVVLFAMHNPSTGDDIKDDPTLKRVKIFARTWGFGGVYVVNLYAFRSSNPKDLSTAGDPVGPNNVANIEQTIREHNPSLVVYAWGNKRSEPAWLRKLVPTPYCIEVSKRGNYPKHPLYLKASSQPTLYNRD